MEENTHKKLIAFLIRRRRITLSELTALCGMQEAFEFMLKLIEDEVLGEVGNGVYKFLIDAKSLESYFCACGETVTPLTDEEIDLKSKLLTRQGVKILACVIDAHRMGATAQHIAATTESVPDKELELLLNNGLIVMYRSRYYSALSRQDFVKLVTAAASSEGGELYMLCPSQREDGTLNWNEILSAIGQAKKPLPLGCERFSVILYGINDEKNQSKWLRVKVEQSDTPKQIMLKTIKQRDIMKIAGIFSTPAAIIKISRDVNCIVEEASVFGLLTVNGVVNLNWNEPIIEQADGYVLNQLKSGVMPRFMVRCVVNRG